jgi:hypothetical protein
VVTVGGELSTDQQLQKVLAALKTMGWASLRYVLDHEVSMED